MRFPAPPLAEVSRRLQPLVDELRAALQLPEDLEAVWVTGATAPPQNLIRLVYVLPASESNHDAEPLGLASHLLRVASTAVRTYREQAPEPAAGSPEHLSWQRVLCAVYIAALLHDLGKLLVIDIKAGERHWRVGRYIADFVREAGVTEISVTHRPGRTRGGPSGHEPVSLLFLSQIAPMAAMASLGSQSLNDVFATLTSSLGAEASRPIFRIVKDADAACAKASLLAQRASARPPAEEPYVLGSGALAEDFVQGFRQVVGDRRVRCNTPDSHILISPSHTVLFVQVPGGQSSIFRLLFNRNAQHLEQDQVGGLLRAFYNGGDPHAFFPEIATATMPNGLSWCVPASAPTGGAIPAIRHFCAATDAAGKNKRRGLALIMRNEALWGPLDPTPRGFFTGRLACFDAADKTVPSVDAEDLAFLPLMDDAVGAKPHILRAAAVSESVEEGNVLELEVVVAELVSELGALIADGGSADHQRRWEAIGVAITDHRLPAIAVPAALEACLDRIRHCRGDRRAFVPPPAATQSTHSRPTTPAPKTQALPTALVARVGELVRSIVRALRDRQDALPSLGPAQDFHGLALAGGSVFLPWPQCLTPVLTPKDQVVAAESTTTDAICAALQLTSPAPVRIAGYTYTDRRRSHRGLLIPASWAPGGPRVPLPELALATGALQAQGGEG